MTLSILARDIYRLKAGKKVKIKAFVSGWGDKKEKELAFFDDDGYVDDTGMFTAPIISVPEKTFQIEVVCVAEATVKKVVQVVVERVEPFKILPGKNVMVFSGGEIQFSAKGTGGDINPYWHIVDYTHAMGMINANSGKYSAPQVIVEDKDIEIEVVDRNSGNKTRTTLKLKSIELSVNSMVRQRVHAGSREVQLDIQSNFCLEGLYDFKCKIISRPPVGQVNHAGLYTPPLSVKRVWPVKVLAVSRTDATKSIEYEFDVAFSLCPHCNLETDAGNVCPSCKKPVAYSAYIK